MLKHCHNAVTTGAGRRGAWGGGGGRGGWGGWEGSLKVYPLPGFPFGILVVGDAVAMARRGVVVCDDALVPLPALLWPEPSAAPSACISCDPCQ